jgi:hypothetical protein
MRMRKRGRIRRSSKDDGKLGVGIRNEVISGAYWKGRDSVSLIDNVECK